jgi:hypothetical protein
MKLKWAAHRPTRDRLGGMSCSEFKTLLKTRGYKVSRDFFKYGCIAKHKGRLYRFRWWGTHIGNNKFDNGFVVDISCPQSDFDRWANSVDDIVSFDTWMKM